MEKTEVKHIKSFLPIDSCELLHKWIIGLKDHDELTLWNTNNHLGGYRFHDPENITWHKDECNRILKPLRDIPELFFETRRRISKIMGFEKELFRKNATSLAGVMFRGGCVEPHTDSSVEGHIHWRTNVLLKCDDGGDPVIDGKIYKLTAGDLIVFAADVLVHSTTIQNSENPRTIISYPFLLPDVSDVIRLNE